MLYEVITGGGVRLAGTADRGVGNRQGGGGAPGAAAQRPHRSRLRRRELV